MPVYFIQEGDLHGRSVSVTGPLHRHLQASLRTQAGDELWLALPSQRRLRVRVTRVDQRRLTGDVLDELTAPPPTRPGVSLAMAILKGEKMDWVVQKSTELGVRSLIPLLSERTVVRPDGTRASKHVERWQRIALEASQQAERWDIPQVETPQTFDAYLRQPPERQTRWMLCERRQAQRLGAVALPSEPATALALVVGPEGGWSAAEVDAALAHGIVPVSLGSHILRAETAALAALSLVQLRWGNLG